MAYVLKPSETEAPESIRAALATGNKVLAAALAQCRTEGIDGQIYIHPLGYHGHAAGPTVGLWDHQEGVPGRGDDPVYDAICCSVELNIKQAIPEWGGAKVMMGLEEDAMILDGQIMFLSGRQEKLHLIG